MKKNNQNFLEFQQKGAGVNLPLFVSSHLYSSTKPAMLKPVLWKK